MNLAQQQFARLERYLHRIGRAGTTDEDYDDLLSFFMHAWHLADWAANDPTVGRSLRDIQNDAKQYPAIEACAGLANGIKHVTLTRPSRIPPQITNKDIQAYEGSKAPSATASYQITLPDGLMRNALTLAQEVVRDWRALISGYGVSV